MADGTELDLQTRVTLLEKSAVDKDYLSEREDKQLERFEKLLTRFEGRMDETMSHAFKTWGHEMGDQLRDWKKKINEERDDAIEDAVSPLRKKQAEPEEDKPSKTNSMLQRWGLPIGVAALVGGPGTVVQVLNLAARLG